MNESQDSLLQHDELTEFSFEIISEKQPRKSCSERYRKLILALLASVLMIIIVIVVAFLTGSFHKEKYPEFNCGKTDSEARSLGCEFDIMEFGWVHPECWDQELLDEYAPPNRWTFGWDRELQSSVTQAQASTGRANALWVKNDYHGAHCVYVFHKMAKAVAKGRPVNSRVRQEVHTHHCSMSIHGITPENFNHTGLGGVNYMSCGYSYLR